MLSSSTPLKSLRMRAAAVATISAAAFGCSGAILAPSALAEPSASSATQTATQASTPPKQAYLVFKFTNVFVASRMTAS